MMIRLSQRISLAAGLMAALVAMAGCGMSTAGTSSNPTAPAAVKILTGRVHGGQQPVSRSRIQLYAVSNTGYKSAATALLTQTVTTGTDGSFGLTGLWNCNDTATYGANPLLYITATGGDPGIGSSNAALTMMTALGPCSSVNASTFILINEVTTTAAAYALSPFTSDAMHIGAPAAEMAGLARAFDTAQVLANPATGFSPGPGIVAGETVPTGEIYTLSNIMAACINSNGSGNCDTLFSLSASANGTLPQDTFGSMLNIAGSPLRNASQLFNLNFASAPFQPTLRSAPADWTMMLKFTGNGLSGPAGIALDGNGNAWVANGSGAGITGLSSQGTPLTGASGYGTASILGAQGVAVDRSGSVWVADPLLSTVFKLTVANNTVQSSAAFKGAVNTPVSLAVDGGNHVWVTNFGDGSVTELSSDGTPLNGSPLTAGGALIAPAGIAVDGSNHVWIADNGASTLTELSSSGAVVGTGFSDNAMLAPVGVAIDAQGRAWAADNGSAGVSLFTPAGASVLAAPVTGSGLNQPVAVAIDGSGVAWLANNVTAGSVTRVSADAASASGGLGSVNTPAALAIDSSGNVWTANSGDNSVSKFVGLATPVHTPLASALIP